MDEPTFASSGCKKRADAISGNKNEPKESKPRHIPRPRKTRILDPSIRVRKASTKPIAANRRIARCIEDCSPEDKMLIQMRDGGAAWGDVKAAWEAQTGDTVAASTLPNRYARLKSNFVNMSDLDVGKMLQAKREVELDFVKEKWGRVALSVFERGGGTYSAKDLRREYTKVMGKHNWLPPPGVHHPDFDAMVMNGEFINWEVPEGRGVVQNVEEGNEKRSEEEGEEERDDEEDREEEEDDAYV